jgi:hypothetical protein
MPPDIKLITDKLDKGLNFCLKHGDGRGWRIIGKTKSL